MTTDSLAIAHTVQRNTDLYLTRHYHTIDYEDRVRMRAAFRIWQLPKALLQQLMQQGTEADQAADQEVHPRHRLHQGAYQAVRSCRV